MGSTRAFLHLFLTASIFIGLAPACANDDTGYYGEEDEAAADVAQSNSALTGSMTYVLQRSSNPTADELDAYAKITAARNAAVTMYNGQTTLSRQVNVQYVPSVATADGNMNGTIRFGSNK
ncbi:MAG: hypothetical protein ACM3ZE_01145 [Myxococcales bacterium]